MWKFTELTYLLASLYYRHDEIYALMTHAGIKAQFVQYSASPIVFWTNIIKHTEQRETINDLLTAIINDGHQGNKYLLAVRENVNTTFKSPYYFSGTGDEDPGQFELITSNEKTFLPISFLDTGLLRAKSVVRVVTDESLGSGFVVNGGYLMTNNHVIPSVDVASVSTLQFDYELNSNGNLKPYKEFSLDAGGKFSFFTSAENDWTVVKIKDFDKASLKMFGYIPLRPIAIEKNDFVNIIQHPGGEHKQIALYHNQVTNVSNSRIQYLTDTLPGSSGSPVFDSKWNLVALHHRGNRITKNGKDILFNQGININLISKELENLGFIQND